MTERIDIEPWKTIVREVSLDISNLDDILTEAMITDMGPSDTRVEDENLVIKDDHPALYEYLQTVVVQEMIKYVRDIWGYWINEEETTSISWVRCTSDGGELQPHHHATPLVSSVLYLEGRSGDLALMDPRGTAERGLPSKVRADNFGTYKHTPTPCSLVIFPSYLFHYVVGHRTSLRIAIPTDLYFS